MVNPEWMYRCDPVTFRKLEQEVEAIIKKGSNAIFFKNENIWSC